MARTAGPAVGPWCARLRGFVSVGRDVYRLFRCKLWPYALEFAMRHDAQKYSGSEFRAGLRDRS